MVRIFGGIIRGFGVCKGVPKRVVGFGELVEGKGHSEGTGEGLDGVP